MVDWKPSIHHLAGAYDTVDLVGLSDSAYGPPVYVVEGRIVNVESFLDILVGIWGCVCKDYIRSKMGSYPLAIEL